VSEVDGATHDRGRQPALRAVTEEAERILRQRAAALARAAAPSEVGTTVEVLLFRLGAEQHAVESRLLQSVQKATGLTPVPSTPAYVAGILNVRGEILTVLDLGLALGLADTSGRIEAGAVLLVELPEIRAGLLVDEVLGVRPLAVDRLDRALSGRDHVRGIAESRIVLLDLERLLSGERFDVFEDAS